MSPYHTLKCQLGEVRWAYWSVERHAHAAFSCPFYKKAHRHRRRDGRMVKRTYCPFVVDATTREQTTQQLGRKVSLYGRARRIYSNNSGGMTNLTGEAHALGLTQTRTHTHAHSAIGSRRTLRPSARARPNLWLTLSARPRHYF